jgi:hypothetical protein
MSSSSRVSWVLAAAGVLMLAGCGPSAPDVPFAKYDRPYPSKTDLAEVEHKFPLTTEHLAKLTPENLAKLDQEQLDQIYARLTAGPIPDGAYAGTMLLPKGMSGKRRLSEIVGGTFAGTALNLKGMVVEDMGEALWKGKVFYRDERVLRNLIDDDALLHKVGLIQGTPRKQAFGGKDRSLLFPAKLYCGQSLLDSRRESVIIDYFFTDEIPGYQEMPDFLAGRRGLRVRDEIRMVRPGFYLGRAYMDRVFGLNFTLYNKQVAERDSAAFAKTGQVAEDCWTGTQQRVVTAAR